MKTKKIFSSCLVALLVLCCTSCKKDDGVLDIIQPLSDKINVQSSIFFLTSKEDTICKIPSKVYFNTYLLGKKSFTNFGDISGRILAQFSACSDTIILPSNVDSTSLYMMVRYNVLNSDADSLFSAKIYPLSQTLNYRETYYSDINIDSYTDKGSLYGTVNLDKSTTKKGAFMVTLPQSVTNAFIEEIKNNPGTFITSESFKKFFKGICIDVDEANTNALLSVSSISLNFYYQYRNSANTLISQLVSFSANKNSRQINAIKQNIENGIAPSNQRLVTSPLGCSFSFKLPIDSIKKKFGIELENGIARIENATKKVSVNSAMLTLWANVDSTSTEYQNLYNNGLEKPTYLLLVKKNYYEQFFNKMEIPDNINAILGIYDSGHYSFSLKDYMSDVLKKDSVEIENNNEFIIVPVNISLSTDASTITAVYPETSLKAVLLYNENKTDNPLNLSVVVSGF